MKHASRTCNIVTWSLLGTIAGASFALPRNLSIPMGWAAPPPPTEIRLGGMVRDFRETHSDFEVTPAGGFGHFAGTVEPTLNGDNRPVFISAGGGTVSPTDVDLVANWPMDEGAGTTLGDVLGVNDGTLTNGPTWISTPNGTGLHFDGIDDHVVVPEDPSLRITGDVTISGWFMLDEDFDATSTSQILMERTHDDNHMFAIVLAGSDYDPQASTVTPGSFVFKLESGNSARYKWTNRTSWVAGQWYHYACVMFGADSASNQIFIDGVNETSSTDWGLSPLADMDWSGPYIIGGKSTDQSNLSGERYFKGILDEIMIVNRALTAAEMPSGPVGGYRVDVQWRNGAAQPIAPHLFGIGPGGVGSEPLIAVTGRLTSDNPATSFDGYYPADGPHGAGNAGFDVVLSTNGTGSNIIDFADTNLVGDLLAGPGADVSTAIKLDSCTISGTVGTLATAVTMPTPSAPTVLDANDGDENYNGGTSTLSDDLHCDKFSMDAGAVLWISGDVTIRAEGEFKVANGSEIMLLPGASLLVYTNTNFKVENGSWVNRNTDDPFQVTVQLGPGAHQVKVDGGSELHAIVESPAGEMSVTDSTFFGTFRGAEFHAENGSGIHLAHRGNAAPPPGCVPVADVTGTAGAPGNGGITDAASFDQWYDDVAGENRSKPLLITLVDDGAGVYEFVEADFHPIDGLLFGDEANAHNRHFTYAIVADFTYNACTGQFIEFAGDDSCWIFIDGQLVLDLGGVQPGTSQLVEIDRLGLADGGVYEMRLFYAQRHSGSAAFSLRTNIPFSSDAYLPTITLMFD